jgi:hypothetical protein
MVYQYRDACGIFGDFIINVLKYVIKNSTRSRRGYIILIAGGALVVAGIAISAAWAGSFVGQFMQENT